MSDILTKWSATGRLAKSSPSTAHATIRPMQGLEPTTTIEPLRINHSPSVSRAYAAMHLRRFRNAVKSAHKAQAMQAMRAARLNRIETPSTVETDSPRPFTRLAALEALYASYRQSRRETVALMARRPHEGRPPMVGTVSGTAANAQETRAAKRWSPSWVERLHRDNDVNPCRSSHDNGATWSEMAKVRRERQSSRKGRAVESLGSPKSAGRIGHASRLARVIAD